MDVGVSWFPHPFYMAHSYSRSPFYMRGFVKPTQRCLTPLCHILTLQRYEPILKVPNFYATFYCINYLVVSKKDYIFAAVMNLRNLLFSLLLLLVCLSSKADNTDKVTVGLTIDSTAVMAESQTFGRRIDDIDIEPGLDYMLIKFRETTKNGKWLQFKGEIGAFSLKESKLLWTYPFDYRNTTAHCTKAGVVVSNGNKVSMLDPSTGKVRWQGKFYPVQFDDSTNVVLGYSGLRSSKLSSYNLTTGQLLWTASMPHDKNWGWNHVIREDSVHWLIVADNLNRVNIRTGEVFAYEAKTGVTDVKGALLQGLVMAGGAIAGAMVTGYAAYPVGVVGPNVINLLHSNVVKDDSLYFFADREHVVCLDNTMNPVWTYEFPSKTSAFSRLVCNDSTLYMFNLGFGLKNGQQRTKMGRPFIAAFDKRTGGCKFMNMLSLKKDMVEDAVLSPDGAFMLFDDGLAYKRELDDSTVTVSSWDVNEHSQLRAIITQPVYAYYNLKNMFDFIASDGIYFPIITENGDIFMVDRELRISERFPAYSIYWPLCTVGEWMCVYSPSSRRQDIWLVSLQGIPEIRLTVPVRGVGIAGGKLYLNNNERLYYLPLD